MTRERGVIKRHLACTLREQLAPLWLDGAGMWLGMGGRTSGLDFGIFGPSKPPMELSSHMARSSLQPPSPPLPPWPPPPTPPLPPTPPRTPPSSTLPTSTARPTLFTFGAAPPLGAVPFTFSMPAAPAPQPPSPVAPASLPPTPEPPLLTPPSHMSKRAEREVLTGDGSRHRCRSLDQSLGRRLFDDEASGPDLEGAPGDLTRLIEKRVVDGGRSQWVFCDAEQVEDEASVGGAGQACGARLREPTARLHTTRAERRGRVLLVHALRAASQPPRIPGRVPPVPFAFPLVRACAARAAPGGLATL